MSHTPVLGPQVEARTRAPKLARMVTAPLLWIVALFAGAGSLHWLRGWISVALYIIGMAAIGVFVQRRNASVMQARTTWGTKGTKRFDRIFMAILMPLVFLHPALAGIDVVRCGWSSMPMSALYTGSLLFACSMLLIGWTLGTNRHAETTVRIQTDRNHTVVTTGPYRFVRHPMYTGAIIMYLSTALVWGSACALLLSVIISALFIWRTLREDRTLKNELAGYREYAKRTRYRLAPGLW